MKFLLTAINAKYIHSNPAIYSLRAYAGENMQEYIELAEYTINQNFTDILADIYKRKPDVIGFSCYIWNISLVLELVRELHKILPEMPIWLGGPEVSFEATQFLAEYPQISGIMVGEGEETFRELLTYYVETPREMWISANEATINCGQSSRSLRNIAGLCLADGYTQSREILDMSDLPFLYENLNDFENRIIYYESSRGCPFRCSYCLSSIDKKVRLRDIETVKKEIQFFLDHRVKQVKFVDRTFNCNHEHAMEIWRYLSEHDNGITNFHFEVSGDILNEEEINLLYHMRPGLVQLEIGVQSVNLKTIKEIDRRMDTDKLEQTVKRINAGHNVHQHLDLIAGLPFEDYASFADSFNRVYAMEPEQLQLGFLKVLRGSRMYEKAQEYGICYMDKPPYEVLYSRWLTYEDVLKLKGIEEMVELYYNSNQFRFTLAFLEKQFETPFRMFEKLAEFYERRGYVTNSPARVQRYHVLLEFGLMQRSDVSSETEKYTEILREILTYDMYLRENLKSRPEFAKDLVLYKEYSRSFYMREEQERKFLQGYEEYDHKQLAKMTHLEPFRFPVWKKEIGESWEKVNAKLSFILFDYKKRDPLTGDARIVVLEETDMKKRVIN